MQKIDLNEYFLPYQKRWLEDKSKFKIWEKSRRIGATYVQSYEDVSDEFIVSAERVELSLNSISSILFESFKNQSLTITLSFVFAILITRSVLYLAKERLVCEIPVPNLILSVPVASFIIS